VKVRDVTLNPIAGVVRGAVVLSLHAASKPAASKARLKKERQRKIDRDV
jgi:hypothetical protein